jgi:large subunit ribosomal protein L10
VKRAEKDALIEGLNNTFGKNPHIIVASFRGLSANQANGLRRKIDGTGGSFRVVRNRLAKRAAAGTPVEALIDQFEGPCALLSHEDDPVGLAKALAAFIKDNPQVALKAGLIDAREQLDPAALTELSKLPALPELRSQMLALFQTPATMLARLLGTPATQLARVIDANRDKQEDGGE